MTKTAAPAAIAPADFTIPFLWPLLAVAGMAQAELALVDRANRFLAEEVTFHSEAPPQPATANRISLDLRTLLLRDYSDRNASGLPVIVVAPYAGHSAMIADYHAGQSLMETLGANGVSRRYLTDWKCATDDMKDLEIDQYLAELNVCIDDLGGRVVMVGLCQGGWMSGIYAARDPAKVAGLVLAGSPIDTDAGDGPLKRMVHSLPTAFYQQMVASGGGLMRGSTMVRAWKGMNPTEHYLTEHIDLLDHIDDPAYLVKKETFEQWYETPIDLPGRWYVQAITQLFKENRLARGRFVALGRMVNLCDILCPTYLLAGEGDDITPREQVFEAAAHLGTPAGQIEQKLVPGGHIGLFMGSRTLKETWPTIAHWIVALS